MIFLERKEILISNMIRIKENILTQGYELPLKVFQLFAYVDVTEFHTFEA